MVIDQFAILHADITCVRYNNSVCNGIAYFYLTRRVGALCDAQLRCSIFCCDCCCCFNFFGIIPAFCCSIRLYNVHNRTCIHISLCHCVGVSECCLFIRSKCKGLITKICMIIDQFASLDTDVACVRYDNCVSDLIPYSNTACRVSYLGDTQFCFSIFCCYCCCRSDFCRIISTLCCSICLDNVYDLTCIHISLCHFVGVGKLCTFIRCESKCLVTQIRMIIDQFAILNTDVAGVSNLDYISHSVTDFHTACRVSFLSDAQFCCCSNGCYCRCCADFCWIISAFCYGISFYRVLDLTSVHICLRYRIIISKCSLFTWCKCKCLVTQICMIIDQFAILNTDVAGVCNLDCISHSVTDFYSGCRICCLGDAQFGFCCFCCDCRSCFYLFRIFATCCFSVSCSNVNDRASVNICLSHYIGKCKCLRFTRIQLCFCPTSREFFIRHNDIT